MVAVPVGDDVLACGDAVEVLEQGRETGRPVRVLAANEAVATLSDGSRWMWLRSGGWVPAIGYRRLRKCEGPSRRWLAVPALGGDVA